MKMDREYFKEKKTGKKTVGRYTTCCDQEKDRHILNKKKPHELELIEQHCEDHLTHYSNVETIEPIFCKKCGRLIQYITTISSKAWK